MIALDGAPARLGVSLLATSPGLVLSPMVFISTGYGGSLVALAAWNIWQQASKQGLLKLPNAGLLHNISLALFGMRLAVFLHLRSMEDSYKEREEYKAISAKMSMGLKGRIMMWIPCSALYVMMAAPAWATITATTEIKPLHPIFALGASMMFGGGLLEAIADGHKTALKKKNPSAFASTGVFRLCRHPSYLGEILFWIGNFIAGIPAMGKDWKYYAAAGLGLGGIVMIMTSSSKRLNDKQNIKYGSRADWQKYTKEVKGVLIPKLF